ncbi:inner membrane protein [Tritonibacter multivorans]|uniref:UPF0056 membrane protein n=1 Tax=Tritonibacter multivorans TaxID=928856 RepID=A0A0P1G1E6_9RHOB|nr:MarC family protein [Tritonibacter multivorans]MDA7419429.1 MarC family protein [Tritonibacter multivorans]CUH75444.1 inner membrane protein [Tritonibacter multivorans]SFC67523.1 multiple antibiotic resistance protein [Tritonibacter multivorans]
MNTDFAIAMFGALFAVMNPFVNLPIFLSLTAGADRGAQRKTAVMILIYTAITCAVVAAAGSAILSFFDISVDAFRVAGGLVLMQIGLHMLNGNDSSAHHGTKTEQADHPAVENIAFYPMTFPMLVGPGTMTTLILFAHKAKDTLDWIAYGLCVGAVIGALGLVLFFAGDIGRLLTATMRTIMTRIMGMILMAIAVGMVVAGLKALLPGLAT